MIYSQLMTMQMSLYRSLHKMLESRLTSRLSKRTKKTISFQRTLIRILTLMMDERNKLIGQISKRETAKTKVPLARS